MIRKAFTILSSLAVGAPIYGATIDPLSWEPRADLPSSIYPSGARSFGVSVLNDDIFVVGGLNWPNAISSVTSYDPDSNAWTQRADTLVRRYAPGAATVDGKLYVVGGLNSSGMLGSVEEYNPVSNNWLPKSGALNQPRYAFSTVALNGHVFAIGGQAPGDVPLATVEEYDPVTDQWTQRASMPLPKVSAAAVVQDGKIYVLGGRNGNSMVPEVYEYDPLTDTWATKASMPNSTATLGAVTLDGKIITFGGSSPGTPTKLMEEYDPATDIWRQLPDMPTIRNESFAVTIADKAYVFGGYDQWSMESVSTVPETGSTFLLLLLAGSIMIAFKTPSKRPV
jgi:N-acetylneuraminic acid mutarotase